MKWNEVKRSSVKQTVPFLMLLAIAGLAHADDAVRSVTMPGLRVPLPAWKETERGTDFNNGVVQVSAAGREISVRWQRSSPVSYADMKRLYELAGLSGGSPQAITVAGHPGERIMVSKDGAHAAISLHWHFPIDGREMMITNRNTDAAEMRALDATMVAGIACHTMPAGSRPLAAFPQFSPPPGFVEDKTGESAPARAFTRGHEIFAVQPLAAGTKIADELNSDERMRKVMLSVGLAFSNIELLPSLQASGHVIWRATGLAADHTTTYLAMIAFACAGEQTVIGHYFTDDRKAFDKTAQHLGRVSCPSKR